MTGVHLDTQVAFWLYGGEDTRLRPAQRLLEGSRLLVSPMVVLELHYLFEIRRLGEPAEVVIADLEQRLGLLVSESAWRDVVRIAAGLGWTRDPFDRLITAHAIADGMPLLTSDKRIRANCSIAVWD